VREDAILRPLEAWLARLFDPEPRQTLAALRAASASADDAALSKARSAEQQLAGCDKRLARYRAALEAGTDPALISKWAREAQAERLAAQAEVERLRAHRSQQLSRDELANLVSALVYVLATAAPEDKAKLYARLGLRLVYDPSRRVVTVGARLGPDSSQAGSEPGRNSQVTPRSERRGRLLAWQAGTRIASYGRWG
jgi:transposase-like protein